MLLCQPYNNYQFPKQTKIGINIYVIFLILQFFIVNTIYPDLTFPVCTEIQLCFR